ncbi:MAG: dienelactone hydrolase family protein [Kineosporiaceae bacterium]
MAEQITAVAVRDYALSSCAPAGVASIVVAPVGAVAAPVTVLLPGWGLGKESMLGAAYRMAAGGCVAVVPDLWLHGERAEPGGFTHRVGDVYPARSGLDEAVLFHRVVAQTVDDVTAVLDALDGDPRCDVSRVGLVGYCVGGYAAYALFARMKRISAAAALHAVPTFTRRWIDMVDEACGADPARAAAIHSQPGATADYTAFVDRIDPAADLADAGARALLMLTGSRDTTHPTHYTVEHHRRLVSHWGDHPERLRLALLDEGHRYSAEAEKLATAWVLAHLDDEG